MNTLSPITANPRRLSLAQEVLFQIPDYIQKQYRLKIWEHYPDTLHFSHGNASGTFPVTAETTVKIDYDFKTGQEITFLTIHNIGHYILMLSPRVDMVSFSVWCK